MLLNGNLSQGNVDFMGTIPHFLGIEFSWVFHPDGHLSVSLTQQSFAESFIDSLGIPSIGYSTYSRSYQSGMSIDSLPHQNLSVPVQDQLQLQYQSIVGSLNWLAHTTHPDLSTVVSLLAQHQCKPSPAHLETALYVVHYLYATKTIGIYFMSKRKPVLESFLHFPVPQALLSMSDANWGPQDASRKKCMTEPPLFTSCSMSAFYVDLFGPLHWISKRQTVTTVSSAEAEIYATNVCVKFLIELEQIFDFLQIKDSFMPTTNIVYNDNNACVDWSKSSTTKGLTVVLRKV
jgi:hypothetical protein